MNRVYQSGQRCGNVTLAKVIKTGALSCIVQKSINCQRLRDVITAEPENRIHRPDADRSSSRLRQRGLVSCHRAFPEILPGSSSVGTTLVTGCGGGETLGRIHRKHIVPNE